MISNLATQLEIAPPVAALYCRISREDEAQTHENSASIIVQKHKLKDFAIKNNFDIFNTYCDDGFSGTSYDRPAFTQMIQDIKAKRVNCVIVKDLSRLGREYIQSGDLLENFFPQHNVRFIAIDDCLDIDPYCCAQNNSMMIPFYNLMNEFYPADISKKTRSAFQTKARQGQYLASYAPFGYVKSPANKNQLIIHEENAKWVRFIFEKLSFGHSLSGVARELHRLKVLTPKDIRTGERHYNWGSSAIKRIAENQTYLGTIVNGKTKGLSYKNKKPIAIPKEKWCLVENMHEPIISKELFEEVKELLKVHKRTGKSAATHFFIGKLRCPNCDNALNFCAEPRKENPDEGYFVCRTNKRFGKIECSRHYIRYSVLQNAVFDEFNIFLSLIKKGRKHLYKKLLSAQELRQQSLRKIVINNITVLDNRIAEIEQILNKLYEDMALNKISEKRYNQIFNSLDEENKGIEMRLKKENVFLSDLVIQTEKIDAFIDELLKFKSDTELSFKMVQHLIDYIEVEDAKEEQGRKVQIIKIYYKFVGLMQDTEIII